MVTTEYRRDHATQLLLFGVARLAQFRGGDVFAELGGGNFVAYCGEGGGERQVAEDLELAVDDAAEREEAATAGGDLGDGGVSFGWIAGVVLGVGDADERVDADDERGVGEEFGFFSEGGSAGEGDQPPIALCLECISSLIDRYEI
jgi:hypothetical protein